MTTTDQDGVTINTLPDNVLVDIFIFYFNTEGDQRLETLLRVCQRWRALVLASPRQLELESVYTGTEPVSEFARDIRPTWPVGIRPTDYSSSICRNITAFLNSKHRHCIHAIFLWSITASELKKLVAAMQKPFPELKYLGIYVNEGPMTPLPDSLLGRSAPLLRQLVLNNCPFPGMPKLLLSATHLCQLDLRDIPHSGYFSPQDLGAALSVMSRLEFLRVEFESPRYPESRHPLSLTRSVLPSLTKLVFEGAHQYLEDLLAQIEPPLLNRLDMSMDVDFVVPQPQPLQLISHTESFKTYDRAFVCVPYYHDIQFGIFREANDSSGVLLKNQVQRLEAAVSIAGPGLQLNSHSSPL
ncbi:hypothetical protein F5148DRAFT_495409 [Russula earlei]|uniref:Uncharacterized protein n=1 Tax=Russula earlei TaxID=71964 RepID=A0ACC0TXI8_9AGAM|nr:hypothetical protein F5148DRAFT_495409 [Russula earlei]